MKLVVIESPFASPFPAEARTHLDYLRDALRASLLRGEAPFASHAIYPIVLDDDKPDERKLGMAAGFAWGRKADLVAVYTDRGISSGMRAGIENARKLGTHVEYRKIERWARVDDCPGGVRFEGRCVVCGDGDPFPP